MSNNNNKVIDSVILFYTLSFVVIGFFYQSFSELISGLNIIFTNSGILITDYMVIGGIGPALVNAGLVGLIGYIIIRINKVPMVGASIAAIFTMIGFGLFGKTVWSIFPMILGVYLYSRYTGKEFRAYIYPALYGTALAPLVSELAFNSSFGLIGGILVGIVAGFILPPLATHLLSGHQGHNLYNVGFTAGFVGLLLTNILRGYGFEPVAQTIYGTTFNTEMRFLMFPMVLSMIILGFVLNGNSIKGYKDIFNHTGVLVTDYIEIVGFGNTLINMGLVGLLGLLYIEVINGHYNGATIGGVLTMIGFAAFGKNPKNSYPLMLGVYLATVFSIYDANDSGPLLAGLFVTTLAPLAGRFGPVVGIAAGVAHLSAVMYTGALHGGLNLYNNGFTGGLIATIFIGILTGFRDKE